MKKLVRSSVLFVLLVTCFAVSQTEEADPTIYQVGGDVKPPKGAGSYLSVLAYGPAPSLTTDLRCIIVAAFDDSPQLLRAGAVRLYREVVQEAVVRAPYVVLLALSATVFSSPFANAQTNTSINFQQLAELTASDGAASDGLGATVAISGNTIVAGAPNAESGVGKAYVFVKPASGWGNATQTAELSPSKRMPNLRFGSYVAVSGSTVVVDASSYDGSGVQPRAYVFVEPSGGWRNMTESAEIILPNQVGVYRVAVAGNTIVASATEANDNSGVIYVFTKPPRGWSGVLKSQVQLTASNSHTDNFLGFALAFDGNTIVATASLAATAYVFVKPLSGWVSGTETAQLTASPYQLGTAFGASATVSNTTIGIGAPVVEGCAGAAYLYYKPSGGWMTTTQSVELPAPDQEDCGYFGNSLALGEGLLAVGANGEGSDYQGAVYVFSGATQLAELIRSDDEAVEEMGWSVAMSGRTIAAGAPNASVGSGFQQGKVYVFAP